MKEYNGKRIYLRYYGIKIIRAAYLGTILIWSIIGSCFGSGFWRNDQPWSNDEGYKN